MGNSEAKHRRQGALSELLQRDCSAEEEAFWSEVLGQGHSLAALFVAAPNEYMLQLLDRHPDNLFSALCAAKNNVQCAVHGHLERGLVLNSLRFIFRVFHFIFELHGHRAKLWEDNTAFAVLQGVFGLMFSPGFGVEGTSRQQLDPCRLWAPGLYAGGTQHVSSEIRENRVELIRCLLAALATPLYLSFSECRHYVDPWAWVCVSKENCHGRDAFFSLLNTALSYNPQGYLPYSGYFTESEDLPTLACQLLVLLLDSKVPSIEELEKTEELQLALRALQKVNSHAGDSLAGLELTNVFRDCISEMSDFEYVFSNMTRLVTGVVDGRLGYFLSTHIEYYQELLLLFWHFIEINCEFKDFVCRKQKVTEIIELLLSLVSGYMNVPGKAGVIQLCVFIFLQLSAHREFNLKMGLRPTRPNLCAGNCYFEQLIILSHTIITSKPAMAPMSMAIMTILHNISAYSKSLGQLGSHQLIALFQHFSSDNFLFKYMNNHLLLAEIIGVINTRLQYQWDGSLELAYALLSQRQIYARLLSLELLPPDDISWALTEEWCDWKDVLPLSVLESLYGSLLPQLEKHIEAQGPLLDREIIEYLRNTTMVGVFPTPHQLYFREYQPHPDSATWFTSFLWGVLLTRSQGYSLANFTAVKLVTTQ